MAKMFSVKKVLWHQNASQERTKCWDLLPEPLTTRLGGNDKRDRFPGCDGLFYGNSLRKKDVSCLIEFTVAIDGRGGKR